MARRYSRTQRVAELIQVELAGILQKEVLDADFGLVTITEVWVSPNFSHAKVFVSTLPEGKGAELAAALNEESKHLRFELAQRIKLRVMPDLRFIYDDTAVHGQRISSLLNTVLKDKKI